jgi:Zn-dependent peptidase ImmA (M78 family)/transcriptional regulator with XRE-family HTH domain
MSTLIYGDRLRQARILRQMSSNELAGILNYSPSTVTKRENSDQFHLDVTRMNLLVKHLGFPEGFFRAPPTAPVVDDDVLFRAPKSTPKREKAYLREFARLAGEVLRWVESKRALPPLLLPTITSRADIASAAADARRALGYSPDIPIKSLTHAVERAGVPVLRRPTPNDDEVPGTNTDKHLGYTTWIGDFWDRPIIVTRGVPSWERTRWTVAHEVGHVVLHRPAVPHEGETAEDEANRFANELLAPIEAVRDELPPTVTLFSLLTTKMRWGISLGALISHLYANRLITTPRRDTLRAQLYARPNPETRTTYGVYEPGWKDRQPEQPAMLRYWLERTMGTAQPEVVAALSNMWPADLLSDMLAEQRSPSVGTRPDLESQRQDVIDLASRRAKR